MNCGACIFISPHVQLAGACNPLLAHRALKADDKTGITLPCNVIVQLHPDGPVEVTAIDPGASMARLGNPAFEALASTVHEKLRPAVNALRPIRRAASRLLQ